MTENVTIKSYPNGIRIFLNPDIPFKDLLTECQKCFEDSAKFFKGAKLAVSFDGRNLELDEEKKLIHTIQAAANINIVCLVGKDKESEDFFAKGIHQIDAEHAVSKAQFFRGSLSNGERFETNESVIILGDVAKDAAVISKKDIIVLGGLYGEAFAGVDGHNHFVVALDFYPRKLKIADSTAKLPDRQKKWGKKQKQGPMMAFLLDSHILTKEIEFTEELLDKLSVE